MACRTENIVIIIIIILHVYKTLQNILTQLQNKPLLHHIGLKLRHKMDKY